MPRVASVEAPPASTESSEASRLDTRPGSRSVSFPRPPLALAYLAPAIGLYALFVLWPLVQIGWISLQRWDGYGPQTFIGLQNFSSLWSDSVFRQALVHSALWELAALGLATPAALGLALLIHGSRLRSVALAAIFFPALIPAT